MHRFFIIAFILFGFQNLYAVESIAEWVKNNVSQNPLIRASLLQIEEIETKSQIAKTWQSPFVDFSLGSKEQSLMNGSLYGISVSQPLPVLGKQNLLSQVYEAEFAIMKLRHQATYRLLIEQITVLAFEQKVLEKKYSWGLQRQQKLKLVDAFLKSRPIASPQINAQAQIVKQQLRKIESELLSLESEREQLNQKLSLYQIKTPVPEMAWLKGDKDIFTDKNLVESLNNNTELLVFEKNLIKLNKEKNLISSESWSDPVLSGSYDQTSSPISEKTYFVGLGIGIPVWGGNQALVNSIDKKIMREQIEFDYQKRMIENELQQALTSYQFTRKQIKLYQPFEINDLEDKFNRLERDFRKELIDLLTYIELDKQIAETVSMTFQAQMDVVNAISKITNLTGRDDLPELLMNQ